jgi:Na+/melibiose symporter-like transporter
MTTLLSAKLSQKRPAYRDGALGRWPLIAFSSITFPLYAAQLPLNVYLPAIYAQHLKIPLALLGTVFLIERIWGTLTDPVVGLLSDRTRNRFGRRRSWIMAGGILFGIAAIFLFFPAPAVSALHLAVTLFIFYFAWSMIQIPYYAWSGEISGNYHERTRIATFQAVAGAISLLVVLTLPTIIDQVRPNDGVLKLNVMGAMILLCLVPSLCLTLRAFPESPAPPTTAQSVPFLNACRLVLRETLLMRVLLSDFAVTLGQGIRGVLFVFFVSGYMELPRWASGLFLLQFVFGIVAAPIWAAIAKRMGKHRTAVAAELLQVAINLCLLLVVPGQLPLLLALTVVQGLAQSSGNLMLRSMVADVADRHRLETGSDRTALFFSVFSISAKAGTAVAVGIALPLIAWGGFDPTSAHNSPGALRTLLLVFTLGPALAHLLSAALVYGFPLDEFAYARVRDELLARDTAENEPHAAPVPPAL